MREFHAGTFDVAVIGAGHAGIEAALAAARLGMETIIFTINLDAVGNMPCNPAIGGTGKGHLVRELDALGGEMARAADAACIQYRLLNRGKGPAVHSLRAQADRRRYQEVMKYALEQQENLWVKQAEIVEILTENGRVSRVVSHTGAVYPVKAAVIATGGSTALCQWMQYKADILNKKVSVSRIGEGTLFGAAALMLEQNTGRRPVLSGRFSREYFPEPVRAEAYDTFYLKKFLPCMRAWTSFYREV